MRMSCDCHVATSLKLINATFKPQPKISTAMNMGEPDRAWRPSQSVMTGNTLHHLLVKIHRQIRRNLQADEELHADIREFLSTDHKDRMKSDPNNGSTSTRQMLLKTLYHDLRKAFNRREYIRSHIDKFSEEKLDKSEREFSDQYDKWNWNNNMSQLRVIVEHVQGILEERR